MLKIAKCMSLMLLFFSCARESKTLDRSIKPSQASAGLDLSPEGIASFRRLYELYSPSEGMAEDQLGLFSERFFPKWKAQLTKSLASRLKNQARLTSTQLMKALNEENLVIRWASDQKISNIDDLNSIQEAELKKSFPENYGSVILDLQRLNKTVLGKLQGQGREFTEAALYLGGVYSAIEKQSKAEWDAKQFEIVKSIVNRIRASISGSSDLKKLPFGLDISNSNLVSPEWYVFGLQLALFITDENNESPISQAEIVGLDSEKALMSDEVDRMNGTKAPHQEMFTPDYAKESTDQVSRKLALERIDWWVGIKMFYRLQEEREEDRHLLLRTSFSRASQAFAPGALQVRLDNEKSFSDDWLILTYHEFSSIQCGELPSKRYESISGMREYYQKFVTSKSEMKGDGFCKTWIEDNKTPFGG